MPAKHCWLRVGNITKPVRVKLFSLLQTKEENVRKGYWLVGLLILSGIDQFHKFLGKDRGISVVALCVGTGL